VVIEKAIIMAFKDASHKNIFFEKAVFTG